MFITACHYNCSQRPEPIRSPSSFWKPQPTASEIHLTLEIAADIPSGGNVREVLAVYRFSSLLSSLRCGGYTMAVANSPTRAIQKLRSDSD